MTIALPESNEILSEALNQTLYGLLRAFESEHHLGSVLGVSGSAVNKIKNGANWPSFVVGWKIARLASSCDIDALADVMSVDDKRTLPVPVDFEGLLNNLIDDEYADSGEHLGHTLTLFRQGRLDEAERRVRRALGALYKMLAEIEARRRGVIAIGDALPNHLLTITP